jgi:hypothetical protein
MIFNILKADKKIELKDLFLKLEINNNSIFLYNEGVDALSGLIIKNILTIMIEYICPSNSQYISNDNDILCFVTDNDPHPQLTLWYKEDYKNYESEAECKRILRGIYWLLFTKRYIITKEDIKYINRKICWQRLYEFHIKRKIIPEYIYKFYNMILFFNYNII